VSLQSARRSGRRSSRSRTPTISVWRRSSRMRPLQLGHSQYQTDSLVRRALWTAAIRRLQWQKTIPRRTSPPALSTRLFGGTTSLPCSPAPTRGVQALRRGGIQGGGRPLDRRSR
jgi:hypothetical protein